jgi:hypothetical protein
MWMVANTNSAERQLANAKSEMRKGSEGGTIARTVVQVRMPRQLLLQ